MAADQFEAFSGICATFVGFCAELFLLAEFHVKIMAADQFEAFSGICPTFVGICAELFFAQKLAEFHVKIMVAHQFGAFPSSSRGLKK